MGVIEYLQVVISLVEQGTRFPERNSMLFPIRAALGFIPDDPHRSTIVQGLSKSMTYRGSSAERFSGSLWAAVCNRPAVIGLLTAMGVASVPDAEAQANHGHEVEPALLRGTVAGKSVRVVHRACAKPERESQIRPGRSRA